MGFDPRKREEADHSSQDPSEDYPRLDPKTVARIDNALQGTISVDISKLSADDKLSLLIDRYDRMTSPIDE